MRTMSQLWLISARASTQSPADRTNIGIISARPDAGIMGTMGERDRCRCIASSLMNTPGARVVSSAAGIQDRRRYVNRRWGAGPAVGAIADPSVDPWGDVDVTPPPSRPNGP